MKHSIKITALLLAMFFATQLIGIAVINQYSPEKISVYNQTTQQTEIITAPDSPQLPYGMQPPKVEPATSLISILFAFSVAVFLILLLMRFNLTMFIKIWFFVVVIIALAITFNSVSLKFNISPFYALLLAIPLAYIKIFKKNFLVHNLTELFVYPGIAAVFVPILNIWAIVVLLLLISVYDIYAVWHSGFMQKMAKFQINKVGVFTGFFVPYAGKKTRQKIKLWKQKLKEKKISESSLKKKKIKINLAILGGGDVVFPIILAGVVLRTFGLAQALIISVFATLALFYLFFIAEKKKFYPAMPYLTAGCLLGLAVSLLI